MLGGNRLNHGTDGIKYSEKQMGLNNQLTDQKGWIMCRIGFTLIEVMVVVSIVALILAILLPSLSKAREQAYEVTCRHNLHQLHLAVEIYAHHHHGWYPLSPMEINPHRQLLDDLKAEKGGLIDAFYCPKANVMEEVAQNIKDYPPVGQKTTIIDTPENRKLGNISYLYWSHKDRSDWRSTNHKKYTIDMDSFRPRHISNFAHPKPFPVSTDPLTPVEVQKNRKGEYWVFSDFFRQGAPFPHTHRHRSGLNVGYRDGHVGFMFGQPRAEFK